MDSNQLSAISSQLSGLRSTAGSPESWELTAESSNGKSLAPASGNVRRLLILVFLLVPSAFAQSGMWGSRGISERFAVNGELVYVADGRGVSVYRVRATIERIDVELSDDRTNDLALAGNELFVATSRGLRRYLIGPDGTLLFAEAIEERDGGASRIAAGSGYIATGVGNKIVFRQRAGSTLEITRTATFGAPIRALQFVDGYLYAGVDHEALYVIDPLREEPRATLPINAGGFARQGSVLWVAAGPAGITSLDIAAPSAPRVVGNSGGGEVNVMDVAVAGTRAFGLQRPNKLYAFDVASPAAPRQTSVLEGAFHVIGARSDRLFVAGSRVDPYGLDTATGIPLRAHDPASLQVLTEFRDLAGPVSGAATDGTLAYVVDPPYFRVIDVHQSAAPRELAAIVVPRIQDRVRIRRNLAAVYGRGLVNLIDISDPYKPRHIATYDGLGIPPSNAAIARDTIVEANFASGLHVADYSDLANPVQISGRIWHYLDLVASDDVIYAVLQNTFLVADLTNRFKVVDVILKDEVGAIQTEVAPGNAPQPKYLLMRNPNAITVYSLADRFHPEELGVVPVPDAGIMGTTDATGWFERDGRLASIDLAHPAAFETTALRVTAPMQIAGSGKKLVVADRYSLRVFGPDTAAPPAPPGKKRAAGKR